MFQLQMEDWDCLHPKALRHYNYLKNEDKMILPYEDSIISEKDKIQAEILKEAKGDLQEYTQIVHKEVEKLREKFKGKFLKSSNYTKHS